MADHIDAACPMAVYNPIELWQIAANWAHYEQLRRDGDMRSWMADQMHEDIRWLLVRLKPQITTEFLSELVPRPGENPAAHVRRVREVVEASFD